MPDIIFFGCRNGEVGHFPFQRPWIWAKGWEGEVLRQSDGKFAPRDNRGQELPQGQAKVHRIADENGIYAILAFWDRSVDPRGASNAMFLVPSELLGDGDDARVLELAREAWPEVFKRFKFEVTLV